MPSGHEQFFIDARGKYLGSFTGFQRPDDLFTDRVGEPIAVDGELMVREIFPYEMPLLPAGAVEVPLPPQDGRDVWNFATSSWTPHAPDPKKPDLDALVRVLIDKGVIAAADLEGKP